jgi:hypothetical protein
MNVVTFVEHVQEKLRQDGFDKRSLNVPLTRRSTPGIRRLVLLILISGTHVGKLYSASTLVLFESASCSWDGGSRASAQLNLSVP